MKIRLKTLWRVPVFCMAASWVSFWATAYLGGFFFVTQTTNADGIIEASADPARSLIFSGVLFLIALLVGGLWCFRSMTKAEIAVSAAIISVIYLSVVLLQLLWIGFPVQLSLKLSYFQAFTSFLASCLFKMTSLFEFSVITACFAPFLFIPFGKKRPDEAKTPSEPCE